MRTSAGNDDACLATGFSTGGGLDCRRRKRFSPPAEKLLPPLTAKLPGSRASGLKQRLITLLTCTTLLSACAGLTPDSSNEKPSGAGESSPASRQAILSQALLALENGDGEHGLPLAQRMVLDDLRSPYTHLILAAAHHLQGDQTSLDLASAGYQAAARFAGQDFWPDYLAGAVAMQRQQATSALEHFAAAALNAPDKSFVFEGLASAAYANGYPQLAEAAAERALKLDVSSSVAWQQLLLAYAAQGKTDAVERLWQTRPPTLTTQHSDWLRQRSATLIRTTAIDADRQPADDASAAPQSAAPSISAEVARQLTVDVTVILSDDRHTTAYGVNLLDGLQGIYSFARSATSIASNLGNSNQTTITRAIRTPEITYNLNLFNRGGRNYEAIARPSLTAFVGEPSNFFIGEQVMVSIAGNQFAQLERIDVGVSLRITPAEIRGDGARFRVEVDRGFFSDQASGTFREALSTFKQSVAATADVKFGETLILSGLSENITDGGSSRTPVLGDIPGVDVLFSRTTQLKRTRSAIVLVTPSHPGFIRRSIDSNSRLERLTRLWDQVIERRIGRSALADELRRGPRFTRPAASDLKVRDLREPALRREFIRDIRQSTSLQGA